MKKKSKVEEKQITLRIVGIYASLHFLTKNKKKSQEENEVEKKPTRSLLTTLFMMIEMKSETTINTTAAPVEPM